MQVRRRAAVCAAVLGIALLAAGCGGSSGSSGGSSATNAPATTAAGGGEKVSLTAKGIAWNQTQLNLPAGKQVTVSVDNQDSVEHNFTFKDANADKDVEAGESAEVSFTAPAAGSYQFFCKYHPSQMKGTVTVA